MNGHGPPAIPTDDVARGVALMVGATAVLSFQDVLGKSLAGRYPVIEMLAVRAVVASAIVLVVVHLRWGLGCLRTDHVLAHLLRSTCMLSAFLLFYRALADLPLADATAIFFGAPFFMAVLGRVILKEELSARRLAVLGLGFLGVLVVVHPTPDGVEPAALLVVAGSFLYPLAMVTTRSLARHDPPQAMIAWTMLIQAAVAGVGTAFVWEAPTSRAWLEMIGLAGLGLVGNVGLILAFSRAPVAVLAPIEYIALVFAAVFGLAVWGDVPPPAFWIGAPLIVASSYLGTRLSRSADDGALVPVDVVDLAPPLPAPDDEPAGRPPTD
ncbi:MAG: DMT family transporter [Acidimicrobiia bacterium]